MSCMTTNGLVVVGGRITGSSRSIAVMRSFSDILARFQFPVPSSSVVLILGTDPKTKQFPYVGAGCSGIK